MVRGADTKPDNRLRLFSPELFTVLGAPVQPHPPFMAPEAWPEGSLVFDAQLTFPRQPSSLPSAELWEDVSLYLSVKCPDMQLDPKVIRAVPSKGPGVVEIQCGEFYLDCDILDDMTLCCLHP